jgi:hypothetical protein
MFPALEAGALHSATSTRDSHTWGEEFCDVVVPVRLISTYKLARQCKERYLIYGRHKYGKI